MNEPFVIDEFENLIKEINHANDSLKVCEESLEKAKKDFVHAETRIIEAWQRLHVCLNLLHEEYKDDKFFKRSKLYQLLNPEQVNEDDEPINRIRLTGVGVNMRHRGHNHE